VYGSYCKFMGKYVEVTIGLVVVGGVGLKN
jgi:hypothetical protein